MRLLYRYKPLPGNVERHQWVNRYCRLKVLPNVVGILLGCTVLKLNKEGLSPPVAAHMSA